jgi:hypothetical protein
MKAVAGSARRFAQAILGLGEIVHPRRQDAQGAGHQFRGPGALDAVADQVIHLAHAALFEPGHQPGLVLGQVDAGDADLLESQFPAPFLDAPGKQGQIRVFRDLGPLAGRRGESSSAALTMAAEGSRFL